MRLAPVHRAVVWPDEDGLRLDQALAVATGLSRRQARLLIAAGRVLRNAEMVRVQARPVASGDVVEVVGEVAGLAPPRRAPPPVAVLFEDDWLVVADKPAGVLSQPRGGSHELALDQRLLLALALRSGRRPFLRLVHRLDRLTSGALLLARRPESLKPLAAAWRDGRVERAYHALVEGHPPADHQAIALPIGRDPGHAWRFRVDEGGRPARTEVSVLHRARSEGRDWTLVECLLSSGRTHQVRVHLAAAGHPVVGDRLYGSRRPATRPLLHASRLTLPHPATGERLRVVSPLAADLGAMLPAGLVERLDRGDPDREGDILRG
jgi:23S rRNA pseudouridine1911/1915/1917 synthase